MSARQRKSLDVKSKHLQTKDLVGEAKTKNLRHSVTQNPQTPQSLSVRKGHVHEHKRPHGNKINMELVFEANKQYLMDKIAIREIPKPSKYYHKIPSTTPNTTYNNQYHKRQENGNDYNNKMNGLKLQRKDNLFNCKNNVAGYESLYNQNFNRNHRSQSLSSKQTGKKENLFATLDANTERKNKNKYQPNDAPAFLDTSYALNFPGNYHPMPAQSAKMKQCRLMGGGKFIGDTTYHGNFSNKNINKDKIKKQKPITYQDNKIFMSIVQPKQTTYDKEFNSHLTIQTSKSVKINRKDVVGTPSSSVKNTNKLSGRKQTNQQGLESSKQFERKKFKSQYERSFQTIDPQGISKTKSKNISLMTIQEMKNLILNVL